MLDATQHPFRDGLADGMLWFIIPLTVVTIVTMPVAEVRGRAHHAAERAAR